MRIDLKEVLKNKTLNDWRLFWLITGPVLIAVVFAMMRTGLSNGEAVSTQFGIGEKPPTIKCRHLCEAKKTVNLPQRNLIIIFLDKPLDRYR
jgi:hypothetical protein